MVNELSSVAGKFGITLKNTEKSGILSQVTILDDKYVLRARELSENTAEKFKKEAFLIEKVRPLIPYQLPDYLTASDGQKFVISDKFFWTVYPFIKGEIICSWQELEKASDSEKETLMKALRNLHDLTKGKFEKEDIFIKDIEEKYKGVKSMLSPAISSRVKQAIERVKNANMNESCFVHGDFHHGNVLVENNEIKGLLDLDWCRVGHPLEDLAFTVMMYLRNYSEKFRFDKEHMQKLLKWYGLDKELFDLFREYLILYAVYDVYIFKHASKLKTRKFYLDYQVEFLEGVCGV